MRAIRAEKLLGELELPKKLRRSRINGCHRPHIGISQEDLGPYSFYDASPILVFTGI